MYQNWSKNPNGEKIRCLKTGKYLLKTLSTLEIRFGKTKVSNAQARKTLDSSLERRTLCRGVKCLFSNGWIKDEDGKVYIYYASSDTRMHIATSNLDQLVDYCVNSPTDQ